jgi:hypothetical protein
LKYTFVVEGKTFNVDVQPKEINKEAKYICIISKVQKNIEGNTEATYLLKPINLSAGSLGKDIPEYWNSESECFNWTHNWVDHNHKRL